MISLLFLFLSLVDFLYFLFSFVRSTIVAKPDKRTYEYGRKIKTEKCERIELDRPTERAELFDGGSGVSANVTFGNNAIIYINDARLIFVSYRIVIALPLGLSVMSQTE